MGKGLFITATGTDVGKTYVTALLVKKLRDAELNAGYYKAALSGAEVVDGRLVPGDAAYVARVANLPEQPENLVSYIYEEAVSPHLAAQREGNPVELKKIKADYAASAAKYDYVTMEGSGGIICPIRWDKKWIMLEDIIKTLNLGVLVVSTAALGSINACVLTVFYLKQQGIPIRGIILNNYDDSDFMQQDNKKMIETLCGVSVLACIAPGAKDIGISADALSKLYK